MALLGGSLQRFHRKLILHELITRLHLELTFVKHFSKWWTKATNKRAHCSQIYSMDLEKLVEQKHKPTQNNGCDSAPRWGSAIEVLGW